MDPTSWLDLPRLAVVALAAVGIYAAVIAATRINGLRSFSTMSAFDFAMTVAVGSLVATVILSPDVRLLDGVVALATLFLLQRIVAFVPRWPALEKVLDNRPRLLVRSGRLHHENLRHCHMTEEDLRGKIREAGLLRLDDVALAVMETSGTVSVVAHQEGVELHDAMIDDVVH